MQKLDKNIKIRFIKLGGGGKWEKDCIEQDDCIRLGYEINKHKESLNGEWNKLRDAWSDDTNSGAITRHINQIRQFYEADEKDIWITFYQRKLYWCQVDKEVIELEDESRIRKVISNDGKWSCQNILKNKDLNVDNLDGRVIKVQGFQRTICGIELSEYLINKINGEVNPTINKIDKNIQELRKNIIELIRGLNDKDFELLVDLIFTNTGFKRMSVLGKTEKHIDIDLLNSINGKRIFVQIKSQASKQTFEYYINIFNEYDIYDEMYFVVHTSDNDLKSLEDENITLIDADRLPDLVINSGLISWLVEKRS